MNISTSASAAASLSSQVRHEIFSPFTKFKLLLSHITNQIQIPTSCVATGRLLLQASDQVMLGPL